MQGVKQHDSLESSVSITKIMREVASYLIIQCCSAKANLNYLGTRFAVCSQKNCGSLLRQPKLYVQRITYFFVRRCSSGGFLKVFISPTDQPCLPDLSKPFWIIWLSDKPLYGLSWRNTCPPVSQGRWEV